MGLSMVNVHNKLAPDYLLNFVKRLQIFIKITWQFSRYFIKNPKKLKVKVNFLTSH